MGFSDKANLDEGAMWPTSFALKELGAAEEAGRMLRRVLRRGDAAAPLETEVAAILISPLALGGRPGLGLGHLGRRLGDGFLRGRLGFARSGFGFGRHRHLS